MLLQPERAACKAALNRSVRNRVPVPPPILAGATLAYLAHTIEKRWGVSASLAHTIAQMISAGGAP